MFLEVKFKVTEFCRKASWDVLNEITRAAERITVFP